MLSLSLCERGPARLLLYRARSFSYSHLSETQHLLSALFFGCVDPLLRDYLIMTSIRAVRLDGFSFQPNFVHLSDPVIGMPFLFRSGL